MEISLIDRQSVSYYPGELPRAHEPSYLAMAQIRVLVIEELYFSRLAIRTVIDSQPDMSVVAEAHSAESGLTRFQEHLPDVVVMNFKLSDQPGIALIRSIKSLDPKAQIAVLSSYDGREYIRRAMDSGALAYLTNDSNAEDLLAAVRSVRHGQVFLSNVIAQVLESRVAGNELTLRERGILDLLVLGWSNKQIGEKLGIAEKTVRIHMSSVFAKLGVTNRTQAVIVALQIGFVDPPLFEQPQPIG